MVIISASLAPRVLPAPPLARRPSHAQRTAPRRAASVRPVAAAAEAVAAPAAARKVSPAVLPGTPAPGEPFPFTSEQLIAKAQAVHAGDTGIQDESVLSPEFKFEFPIVKMDRAAYLKTVRGFTFKQGIPNLSSNAYGWSVDPYEPNRVWFFIRTTGTHTGPFKFGSTTFAATNVDIQGPPEVCSYTFDKEGKVTSFTGGYVADNRVGNTDGLGAAFGILAAIGVKVPRPGSLGWTVATTLNRVQQAVAKLTGNVD
ncbi:amidase signature enzyme [Micractinium conductrix]|uniref:Amidase signature enzyme n=1 Tax=Micractinium conductrix TaxID=554055 RepID=A0A2P6VS44_9CHLO|nr:amidase signature enzyme [Micractinium conductrix]|eukprot:PSC76916.1 amidase signature enzyme [Micractinium conductrix]